MTRPTPPPILTVFLVVLVVEGAVGTRYASRPSYYWSRAQGEASKVSQRSSHIGPLPRVNDVMMEWSSWGPWARCSRSCGGGVKSRSRSCVTRYPRVMPGSGVRTSHDQCGGESVEYHVCGASPCPPTQVSALSFRAAQCRHYNNKRVFGRVVNNWVPYTQGGINPCALVCEGEGQGLVYTFGKVTDGTRCSSGGRDGLCVNGRCMPLSCDGRLGGRAREDMCRICGGNNDTCTHHVGIFHTDLPSADQPPLVPSTTTTTTATNNSNSPHSTTTYYGSGGGAGVNGGVSTPPTPPLAPSPSPPSVPPAEVAAAAAVATPDSSTSPQQVLTGTGAFYPHPQPPKPRSLGYYEVTNIPRGATNVRVKDASANFLALRAGSKYLLNGDWLIDWPGEVDAGGTTFTYTRQEDESESLTSLGPTSQNLTLMVLLREHNPGIYYEYWTPNTDPIQGPSNTPDAPSFTASTTTSTTTPPTTSSTTASPTTATTTSSTSTPTTIMPSSAATTPRPAVITSVNVTKSRYNQYSSLHHQQQQQLSSSGSSSSHSSSSSSYFATNRRAGRPRDNWRRQHQSPLSSSSSRGFVSVLNKSPAAAITQERRWSEEPHWNRPVTTSVTASSTYPRHRDNESHKTPLSRHKPRKPGERRGEDPAEVVGGGRGRGIKGRESEVKQDKRRGGEQQPSEAQNRIRGNRKRKKKRKKKTRKDETKKGEAGEERGRGDGRRRGRGRKRGRVEGCGPCPRMRRRTKQMFCTSDFVSQVEVVNSEVVAGELRYEVLVHQSYKNTVPLLHKEFLWIPDPCQCPRLRPGLTYLVMGTTDNTKGREVRLVLPRHSYVRRFKAKNLARILKVRHNEMRFCRPWRRDLRFLLPRPSQQGQEQREELEQGQSSVLLKSPEDLQHEDKEQSRHEHLLSHHALDRIEHNQHSPPRTQLISQNQEYSQYQHYKEISDGEDSSLYQHREEESSSSHQYDQGGQPNGTNQEGEVEEPLQHLGQDGGRSTLRDDERGHLQEQPHLRPHQQYDHAQREQNNEHKPREEDHARNHIPQGQSRGYDHHPPGEHLEVKQQQQQPGDQGRDHSMRDPREPDCEPDQDHKSPQQKPHSDPTQHPGEQTDHKPQKQERKGVHWLRRWQEYRRRYIYHQRRQRQRHRVQSYHHHHTAAPREREDNSILSGQRSI